MAILQVRNLPDDVHEVLRRRAEAQGVSLAALVTAVLAESAAVPTTDEWLAEWRRRRGGGGREGAGEVDVPAVLDEVRDEYDAQ